MTGHRTLPQEPSADRGAVRRRSAAFAALLFGLIPLVVAPAVVLHRTPVMIGAAVLVPALAVAGGVVLRHAARDRT